MGKKIFKIGIDIHGIIDTAPKFFSLISNLLVDNGHEVFIITGPKKTDYLIKELNNFKIKYTKLLSITDYNISKGHSVKYDENGNPWFSDEIWNKTKSILCSKYDIDFHIDDSEIYGEFFETPYAMMKIKNISK